MNTKHSLVGNVVPTESTIRMFYFLILKDITSFQSTSMKIKNVTLNITVQCKPSIKLKRHQGKYNNWIEKKLRSNRCKLQKSCMLNVAWVFCVPGYRILVLLWTRCSIRCFFTSRFIRHCIQLQLYQSNMISLIRNQNLTFGEELQVCLFHWGKYWIGGSFCIETSGGMFYTLVWFFFFNSVIQFF